MSILEQSVGVRRVVEELVQLRGKWGWFLALGIGLVILGFISLGAPLVMTLTTVTLFGFLLLFGGVFELVSSFGAGKWSGFFLQALGGVLKLVVGVILIERPVSAATAFTLVLALFLIGSGLFRIIVAVVDRFPMWGWVAVGGGMTLLLGILIWRELPEASLWVIGTFIGIDLVLAGGHWVMFGLAVRKIPVPTRDQSAPTA